MLILVYSVKDLTALISPRMFCLGLDLYTEVSSRVVLLTMCCHQWKLMTFGDMRDQVCASIRNGQVIETLQRRKEASESALCHQTRRSVSCPGSTAAGNSSIASVNRHNTGSQNDCPRQRQRLGLTRAMGEVERHRRLDASRPRSQPHHTTLFGQVKSTYDRTLYQ
jgi:hypothetical protein